MNETKKTVQKNSPLSLLLLALCACVAAVAFRHSSGLLMILPIYPLCVAAACLLSLRFPVKRSLRAVFFLVPVAALNLVENTETKETVLLLLTALVSFLLVELAIRLFMKKRALPCICGVLALCGCLTFSGALLGNPILALQANSRLNDYIASHYTNDGRHRFEPIQYDRTSGLYTVKASNTEYPTESSHIFLTGGIVVDHYRDLLEDQAMRNTALSVTETLREAFSDDIFTVTRLGIDGFPNTDGTYSIRDSGKYADRSAFRIHLSGTPTYEKLKAKALSYSVVLSASDTAYGSVLFTGGEGVWYRMAFTPLNTREFFPTEQTVSVYVLRHNEHYELLKNNGLSDFLEKRIHVSLNLYESPN